MYLSFIHTKSDALAYEKVACHPTMLQVTLLTHTHTHRLDEPGNSLSVYMEGISCINYSALSSCLCTDALRVHLPM